VALLQIRVRQYMAWCHYNNPAATPLRISLKSSCFFTGASLTDIKTISL